MWSLDESTVCLLASFVNVQAKDQIYLKLLKAISISSSLAALLLLHFFLCVYNHCLDMRLLIVQYEKSRMAKNRKRSSWKLMLTIELSFSVWDHHGHSGLKSEKKVYCFVLISQETYRIEVLYYDKKKFKHQWFYLLIWGTNHAATHYLLHFFPFLAHRAMEDLIKSWRWWLKIGF